MTTTDAPSKFRYEGNGSTDTFAFTGRIFAAEDLVVEIITRATDALADTLTLTTDYSVTISGPSSASVTVTAPNIPSASQDIQLRRALDKTQSLVLPTGTVFPAKAVETALDKATAIIQEMQEEIDRSVKLSPTSSIDEITFAESPQDGKAMVYSTADGGFINGPDAADIAAAQGYATDAETAKDDAETAAAAAVAAAALLPLNNYTATAPPTVNDDSADGYSVGSRWIDTTGDLEAWTCASASVGAAQWLPTTLTVDDLGSLAVLNEVAYANIAAAALADSAAIIAGTASKIVSALVLKAAYPNMVVQTGYAEYATNTNISTVIPRDDTIPQVGEGTEILSVAITPKTTTNKLRIRFSANFGGDASVGAMIAALFVNGAANAVQVRSVWNNATNTPQTCVLEYEYTPGSVSAQTLSIRVGPSAGTMRVNGTSAAREYGGAQKATIMVEEITA